MSLYEHKMKYYRFHIVLINLFLVSTRLFGQIDSLVLYDPYYLTKADLIIEYDTNALIEEIRSSIGHFGNKTDLALTLPDSILNRFTNNNLASDVFDLSSFPIRTNIALHSHRFYGNTDYYKAGGSGILVSPNAVLTAGHLIGYEANHIDLGKYFKWKDSLYVTPSLQDGYPQPEIGNVKVKKCYLFKRFVNSLGHAPSDDLALLILEEPIGYEIGWIGLGYVTFDSFLLDNTFYNFSYPGMDGYDGLNMYYKYGQFSSVNFNLTSASNGITGIPGESGSGFFYTDNLKYETYGVRTYASSYTLITEDKFRIFDKILKAELVTSISDRFQDKNEVLIFPNPADEFIIIKINNTSDFILSLKVYNLHGQIIMNDRKIEKEKYINIGGLQPGLYMIEVITSNTKTIRKQIVK